MTKPSTHTTPSSFKGFIGVSSQDITPSIGIYTGNWGAADIHVATGIHQSLMMSCMTFQTEKNNSPLVLLTVDLGWWKNSQDEKELRSRILNSINIPEPNLMLCLSHTHSGPSICQADKDKKGGELIPEYFDFLINTAIDLISNALGQASIACLSWSYGKCSLAQNRDLKDSDKDRYLVGYNPEAEADDTLLVGRATNSNGQIIGTIVNYACHPTTLAWENTLLSPDYIGSMREIVTNNTQSPVLFLQGASGELAPAIQYTGDTKVAEGHGRELGYAVLSTLESMPPPETTIRFKQALESGAPLALWSSEHHRPDKSANALHQHISYEVKSMNDAKTLEGMWKKTRDPVEKERLWRKYCIRSAIGDGERTNVPIWIWKLGGAFLIGQPNEAYSVFQQTIRDQFNQHHIAIMNLVNGSIGYLPPKDFYSENIYSVWQTPFEKGSLENLIKETSEFIHQMKRN